MKHDEVFREKISENVNTVTGMAKCKLGTYLNSVEEYVVHRKGYAKIFAIGIIEAYDSALVYAIVDQGCVTKPRPSDSKTLIKQRQRNFIDRIMIDHITVMGTPSTLVITDLYGKVQFNKSFEDLTKDDVNTATNVVSTIVDQLTTSFQVIVRDSITQDLNFMYKVRRAAYDRVMAIPGISNVDQAKIYMSSVLAYELYRLYPLNSDFCNTYIDKLVETKILRFEPILTETSITPQIIITYQKEPRVKTSYKIREEFTQILMSTDIQAGTVNSSVNATMVEIEKLVSEISNRIIYKGVNMTELGLI